MPLFIDFLSMEVDPELTDVESTSFSVNKWDQLNDANKFFLKIVHFYNKMTILYVSFQV